MKLGHVVGGLGSLAAIALAVACSGKTTGGSSGSACADISNALSAFETACEPGFLDTSRFQEECENAISAPGTSSTYASALESCASTINSATATCGRSSSFLTTGCTAPVGTLQNGAACGTNTQCASGYCALTPTSTTTDGDGGTETSSGTSDCGVCAAETATGQPCTFSTQCAGSAAGKDDGFCDESGTTGSGTCAVPTYSAIGGPCGTNNAQCNGGLRCDATSQKCAALSAAGGACNFSEDCNFPLVCTNSVCATGAASGQACTINAENGESNCVAPLGCDPTSNTCATVVTNVAPGGACDGQTHLCADGSCDTTSTTGSTTTTGTCSVVIPDGAACDPTSGTAQCKNGSECINKICVFPNPSTCS